MRRALLIGLVVFHLGCGAAGAGLPDGGAIDFASAGSDGSAADLATASLLERLRARTAECTPVAGSGLFATDYGESETTPICQLPGAIFFSADLDIDCDGGRQPACTSDPYYLPDTSAVDSSGKPLDANSLPFVVLPLASNGFAFRDHGIELGSVVAVMYGGQLRFGVFGDEGPRGMIGEASYAMATRLGIDPDPVTGGIDAGVTYIVFGGSDAIVDPIEDEGKAQLIGMSRASQL